MPAFTAQSASRSNSSNTFIPSSHDIHKSPLQWKRTHKSVQKWNSERKYIHIFTVLKSMQQHVVPDDESSLLLSTASLSHQSMEIPFDPLIGMKLLAPIFNNLAQNRKTWLTFAHLAKASAFVSHGICTHIGFPSILSNFPFFVAAQ